MSFYADKRGHPDRVSLRVITVGAYSKQGEGRKTLCQFA